MNLFCIFNLFLGIWSISTTAEATQQFIRETVYVETTIDTDNDGELDKIFVEIKRPIDDQKWPTLLEMSPYNLGGNQDAAFYNIDLDYLPQDQPLNIEKMFSLNEIFSRSNARSRNIPNFNLDAIARDMYAQLTADSLGTGRSTGCPTGGDMAEALAGKAVIDWLNGRARAYSRSGEEVYANWANGNVGMIGVSYNGTLPIMVAATGVEGLKAIVPIAAIASWYDYYRANGLVINPRGYPGEDLDVLANYIVRRGTCAEQINEITKSMGRENGDYTPYWENRNFRNYAENFKAATFIIHGQNDWNVKPSNAIKLWHALEGVTPLKMFLHKGGHSSTGMHNVPSKINQWFDHFVRQIPNNILKDFKVEVELEDENVMRQNQWPSENTFLQTYFFNTNGKLSNTSDLHEKNVIDVGRRVKVEQFLESINKEAQGRLIYLTESLSEGATLSGTTEVSLKYSIENRRAANLTVVVFEVLKNGRIKHITRGWADAQNHNNIDAGDLLNPGEIYRIRFKLEPRQYRFAEGSRLGVMITSTDQEFNLRPKEGTKMKFFFDAESFIKLNL